MNEIDEATEVVLHVSQDVTNGDIDYRLAELRLKQVAEFRQTLDSGANLMRAGSELAHASREIFVAAFDTYHACKELDRVTRQFEAQAAKSIAHIQAAAPALEKTLDRLLNLSDRLLDQILAIDVDTCSDRQLANREMLTGQLVTMSGQANALLMKFLTL